MEIFSVIAFIVIGTTLLYLGAEGLVGGAARLALRYGLTPLAVGLTVVAFGTSSPELIVSMSAAAEGNSAIASGNVVGSNISNIALILGICAVIRPIRVHAQVVKIDTPIMIAVSLVVSFLMLKGHLTRLDGVLLFTSLLAYTCFNYVWSKRNGEVSAEDLSEASPEESTTKKDLLWVIGGLIFLTVGAKAFVYGAVTAARMLGMSDTLVGLTIVALGTSLPELATSLVATWKGETDIVIGNIIGSNVFNLLCILGATALVLPIETSGLSLVDLGVMLLTSIALLPILGIGHAISRGEGGVLLGIYFGYLWWLLN